MKGRSKKAMNFGLASMLLMLLSALAAAAQNPPASLLGNATKGPRHIPAPSGVPQAGPTNDAPYAPQPILPGGVVVALYPSDSPQLNQARVREAEQYNLSKAV